MPASLSRAPHVLLTADAVGGVWTYALDLAQGLVASEVAVTLAVVGPAPDADQRRQVAAVEGLALTTIEGPLDWTASRVDELRPVAAGLARLARQAGVDLIHLNSPALAALADFEPPVLGTCHSCMASWWAAVLGGPAPADFAWRRDLLARGYAACDALAAPSQAFAQTTAALYGMTPSVVRNGRRASSRKPVHKRPRFALTAGRLWDEGKDVATLNQTAAMTAHPIVALGPLGGPKGSLRFEQINTPGPQSAEMTADWMVSAPVFVSTAVYEPFGLAVLEAAQAGAALVLSDIATFRELWDGAAMFVAPRDAAGFAAAIDRLLIDDVERAQLADQARARADRYTVEAMVDATLAQYARLSPAFSTDGRRSAESTTPYVAMPAEAAA